jgi:SAM-dependent methyltransferase
MTPTDRAQALFFELFEGLPRQGPGNRASTARALALCTGLPAAPRIVDLGCGSGAQTFDLAELTTGALVAIDAHAPLVARLRAEAERRGLAHRIDARVADLTALDLPAASFDLAWSEGALYAVGLARGLAVARTLLHEGGCLAFSDAVWRTADPLPEVRALFADYPTMGRVEDVLALLPQHGFTPLGHFPLPDAAWWDDFYTPMEARIAALRTRYAGDGEALTILDDLAREPALHRAHGHTYGYEVFVARATIGAR